MLLIIPCSLRFTDPANRTVTDSIVKEVRGQFPHFTEGQVKCKYSYLGTSVLPEHYVPMSCSTVSCNRYFRTLCQKDKRKASYDTDLHKQKYRQ